MRLREEQLTKFLRNEDGEEGSPHPLIGPFEEKLLRAYVFREITDKRVCENIEYAIKHFRGWKEACLFIAIEGRKQNLDN